MARKGDGPVEKLGVIDRLQRNEPELRRDRPILRRFDPDAAAALSVIARQLGMPVERFYGAGAHPEKRDAADEAEMLAQEGRLLSAFGRIADPMMRQNLVELAETLALDP